MYLTFEFLMKSSNSQKTFCKIINPIMN
jgi:hypothetical protein